MISPIIRNHGDEEFVVQEILAHKKCKNSNQWLTLMDGNLVMMHLSSLQDILLTKAELF